MAGGRDLRARSPRWLNGLICGVGIAAVGCFLCSVVLCEAEATRGAVAVGTLASRVLGCAMLPTLVVVTMVERAVRRVRE